MRPASQVGEFARSQLRTALIEGDQEFLRLACSARMRRPSTCMAWAGSPRALRWPAGTCTSVTFRLPDRRRM